MQHIYIHPHALKHGLDEAEIKEVWKNFVAKAKRAMPKDDQIVCIGFSSKRNRAIQMIAVENKNGLMIFHAMTPPQTNILKELGIEKRKKKVRKNENRRTREKV